jgi:hypothetical protein
MGERETAAGQGQRQRVADAHTAFTLINLCGVSNLGGIPGRRHIIQHPLLSGGDWMILQLFIMQTA